jgi:cardiolipin synthase
MARNEGGKTNGLRSAVWTVANLLSVFRILLAPVFVWSVLNRKASEALLIFFIAGATDLLDGFAARTWHQRSRLGTILDPAGDKLLMAASYIVLTLRSAGPNVIPLWLTILVFSRDLLIVSGALFAYLNWRQTTFLPSLLGKLSTGFQVGTVFGVLFFNWRGTAPAIMNWLYGATLFLTVGSGVDYVRLGLKILKKYGDTSLNSRRILSRRRDYRGIK